MSPTSLLAVSGLYLRRGERELYAGLSAAFGAGEIWWLRGENGRGKTTLLRILAGLLQPEAGILHWRGGDFSTRLDEPKQAISLLDERLGLGRDLTVGQNLRGCCDLAGEPDAQALLQRLELQALAHRPVRELSTGQKKRVGLARLLAEGSPVWLLDEPTNGLDTVNRQRLAALIQAHADTGGLCIMASHDAVPVRQSGVQELVLN